MSTNNILEMEDARLINKGLAIREQIIDKLFVNNTLPSNEEDRELLMRSIEGIDKTVLSKTKIKVEKDNSKSTQETAKMMADILSRVTVKNLQSRKDIPALPKEVVVQNPIEGEKEIGTNNTTYEEFMNRDK